MSGLNDTEDSEVEQNGQKGLHPSKDSEGKLKSWKEEEEGDDDEEEEDVDFNPFLIVETASEASSSLSSEDEGSADNSQKLPFKISKHQWHDAAMRQESKSCSELSGSKKGEVLDPGLIQEVLNGKHVAMGKLAKDCQSNTGNLQGQGSVCPVGSGKCNVSSDETQADEETIKECSLEQTTISSPNQKNSLMSAVGDEDAICMRTRARHSLADFTLEELEAFLQESDDDDDLQHVDDEEEYRKFLAAVLSGGNDNGQEKDGHENMDEDEENDADFEIEVEEALESDADENIQGTHSWQEKHGERLRSETRQKRFQRNSTRDKKKFLVQAKIPLRPIFPFVANPLVGPVTLLHGWHSPFPNVIPHSSTKVELAYGFTSQQIGQLFCLIHEHVQLLIQVFSLSVHDPPRQHIATKTQMLILEMVDRHEEVLAWRKVPYPVYCFDHLHFYQSVYFDPSQRENSSWAPSTSSHILSILDVESLGLAKKFVADVSATMLRYRQTQIEGLHSQSDLKKEPLFTFHDSAVVQEKDAEGVSGTDAISERPKKSLAAMLVERTKRQSVALVPGDIANLAQTFRSLFNPALFPHKPPPPPVANRLLFTDSEDGLLAMGLMEYNNDWAAIQQRFLPCKSKHQIFVRQKNRSSSKSPENPIKAVRHMKTSPLTADEKVLIAEGLKLFKHDWISVWRIFVPHRDPSLLPRQWRIATGTQKSYRKDEAVNEKRRLYEAKRRKFRVSMTDWQREPDYEVDGAGQNVADDKLDNKDQAYVHEAFLADVEPGSSKQNSSEPHYCVISEQHFLPGDISPPKDAHVGEDLSAVMDEQVRSAQVNTPVREIFNSSRSPGDINQLCSCTDMPITVSSTISSNQIPFSMPSTRKQVSSTYRRRKMKAAQVVQLAPELPPVNLPPSVHVISQSAFRSYHALSSPSVIDKRSAKVLVRNLPCVSNSGTARTNSERCETASSNSSTKDNPGKDLRTPADHQAIEEHGSECDIQMHPLLFQVPDAEHPLYYTKNYRSTASRSFDFFAAGHERVNLKLLQPEQTGSMVEYSFPVLQSKETHLGGLTIDFHPLLQRTNEINCNPAILCPAQCLPGESERNQCNNIQSLSPSDVQFLVQRQMNDGQSANSFTGQYDKDNELDLDIHLYSATNKRATGGRETIESQRNRSRKVNKLVTQMEEKLNYLDVPSHGHNVRGDEAAIAANLSICQMESTIGLNVESRTCAKASVIYPSRMTLSSGDVYQNANNSVADQPSPEIVMEQEELSDSDEEADKVEFECEEMDDSEGECLDGEQPDKIQNKE